MLVDHLLAAGPVPLDYITFISFILPLLHIYILHYILSSSPVCAMTRSLTPLTCSFSQQAAPLLYHPGRTLLDVWFSNTSCPTLAGILLSACLHPSRLDTDLTMFIWPRHSAWSHQSFTTYPPQLSAYPHCTPFVSIFSCMYSISRVSKEMCTC